VSARVLVDWRGYRRWWGRRFYGAGARFPADVAEAVAAELNGRGHVARVVLDVDLMDTEPRQMSLFGGGHETRSTQ